jgi:hypothetical protein
VRAAGGAAGRSAGELRCAPQLQLPRQPHAPGSARSCGARPQHAAAPAPLPPASRPGRTCAACRPRRCRAQLGHLAELGLGLTAFNDSPAICASLAALARQLTRLELGVKDYRGGEGLALGELAALGSLSRFGLSNGWGWTCLPLGRPLVARLAAGWPRLEALRLQLARGDLRERGAEGLALLRRFTGLRELSLAVGPPCGLLPGEALQVRGAGAAAWRARARCLCRCRMRHRMPPGTAEACQ